MLTLQSIKNIKLGSRITFYNGLYAILISFLHFGFINSIIRLNFNIINSFWPAFSKYNPEISSLFIRLMILRGIFMLSFGIILVAFSIYILKRKDKTAWAVLFLSGGIFWLSLFITELFDFNAFTFVISLIGLISFLIGMIIPLSYFAQKSFNEY